jgi:hypothetical protein
MVAAKESSTEKYSETTELNRVFSSE